MPFLLRSLFLLMLLAGSLAAKAQVSTAPGTVVTSERVRAELMAHAPEGVAPGKPVWVGLQLAHQPEWHTYWKNSGDSGLPTQLQWTLPAGVIAGDIAWPVPRKIPVGTLANYGYEGTVLLPVPLTIGPDFKPSLLSPDLTVKLKATWLVCKKECIPEDGDFVLKLPVRSTTALHGPEFDAAFAAQPKPLPHGTQGIPDSGANVSAQGIDLQIQGLPVAVRGKRLELFPETPDIVEPAGAWTQAWKGAVWTAHVPYSSQRSSSPSELPMVVAEGAQGWRASIKVAGTWPPPAAAPTAGVSPALQEALRSNAAGTSPPASSQVGLVAALFGALLGGLILNLMPCVFPVLAIKLVAFASHAQDSRRRRADGLAYTAGVVVSFLALGAAMLVLRSAGEQLGWGFQLQSPVVVAVLAALFTLIALNLVGLFEFGAVLPSSIASVQVKHPVRNAFVSGVLAVAIASPCTAPFMGASLGLAATLPAIEALLVFAVLGAGMALPYLAASAVPAVGRWLPRPGPWMDVFRKLMAFPMFATEAWLVWVLGQQSGIDGAGALLVLLVAFSLLVWTLTLRGRVRTVLGTLAVIALLALGWAVGPQLAPAAAPAQAARADGAWQPWSQDKVTQLVAAGQPVFVDFTAAWCVTCQVNKKTTLSNDRVLADLRQRNVALLRADWTRRDPAITAALASLGRNGVPVYVFYRQGSAPVVLSELLGVDEVRQAIARL
ncbi:MAG: protein-disulfide reductase DsbD family protein [Ramlibacter sp.]